MTYAILIAFAFRALQQSFELPINPPAPLGLASQLPYPKPAAEVTRPRVFWTSDLHDGTRCDIATTLSDGLGQEVLLAGLKMDRAVYPACITSRVHLPKRPLAPLIARLMDSGYYITEEEIRFLFEYYKDDPDMQRTDAFVCMFPLSYCEAFLPFNRTVIYLAAHRYALGRCNTRTRWDHLTKHLIEASSRGHIVAAMGRYDAEYINVRTYSFKLSAYLTFKTYSLLRPLNFKFA